MSNPLKVIQKTPALNLNSFITEEQHEKFILILPSKTEENFSKKKRKEDHSIVFFVVVTVHISTHK